MSESRFDRQELLFGKEGQAKIAATTAAIIGVGGLGTRVIQDLVFLGVRRFILVEPGSLKQSSRNRYIGQRQDDPIPGTSKLAIAERLIKSIDRDAVVITIEEPFPSDRVSEALLDADVIFGCLDTEGARLLLNNACAELGKPYIDLGTEIHPSKNGEKLRYGGRVFVTWARPGCLVCCDVLDMEEAAWDLATPEARQNRDAVYGVTANEQGSGPSVVTLNGVIASIATTEFMVAVTGLRDPVRLTTFYGDSGRFTTSKDAPKPNCLTCNSHPTPKARNFQLEV